MKRWVCIAAISVLLTALAAASFGAGQSVSVKMVTIGTGDENVKVVYPRFSGSGDVVKAANADLERFARERLRGYRKEIKEMKQSAEGTDVPVRYFYELKPTVSIACPDLISLYFTLTTYTGGAHGMTYYDGRSYGTVKGKARRLSLQDLFKPGVDARKLAGEKVYAKLQNNPNADWISEGMVESGTELTTEFVITPKGLTFLIEPYAVGPYAAGSFFVKIPFEEFGDALASPPVTDRS